MRRLFWEAVVVIVLLAAGYGAWTFSQRKAGAELAELRDHQAAQLEIARQTADTWASALAASEASAVFASFAAAIHPNLLASRRDVVDSAVGELIQLEAVTFAHVLEPGGKVISTSDRKLAGTGRVGERAAWVLGATETTVGVAEGGITEVAGPIQGAEGPLAVLWIGYDTETLKRRTRPTIPEDDGV